MSDTAAPEPRPISPSLLQRLNALEQAGSEAQLLSPAFAVPVPSFSLSSAFALSRSTASSSSLFLPLPPSALFSLPAFRCAVTPNRAQRRHWPVENSHWAPVPIDDSFGPSLIDAANAAPITDTIPQRRVTLHSRSPAAPPVSAASSRLAVDKSSLSPIATRSPRSKVHRSLAPSLPSSRPSVFASPSTSSLSAAFSFSPTLSARPVPPSSALSSTKATTRGLLTPAASSAAPGASSSPSVPFSAGAPILASLSLSALKAWASDPAMQHKGPSEGTLVDRLVDGRYKRYILYSCLVCGKQTGDKSKHHKHERACKTKVLRQLSQAEKEKERLHRQAEATEKRRQRESEGNAQPTQLPTFLAEMEAMARMAQPTDGPSKPRFHTRREEEGKREGAKGERKDLTRSQLQPLIARELRALYHGADAAPDSCLHSRHSVLTRIDLKDVFQSPELWSHFTEEEMRSLCSLLPNRDQLSVLQRNGQQSGGEDSPSQLSLDEPLPAPSTASAHSSPSSSASIALVSAERALLRTTVLDRSFCRSLEEYQTLLSSGSIDPALKGLRRMAEGRRRREDRLHRSWKQRHTEVYWGEALSETRVHAKQGGSGPSSAKGKRSSPSQVKSEEEDEAEGGRRGTKRRKTRQQQLLDEGEQGEDRSATTPVNAKRRRSSPLRQVRGPRKLRKRRSEAELTAEDSEVTQSDISARTEEDSEVEEEEETDEGEGPSPPLSPVSTESDEPHLLHRRFRRSRLLSVSSMGEDEGVEDESPHSPPSAHSDGVPPPPALSLPQPAPRIPLPLPLSYPIIQRFHFRSPRFRHIKRAVFLLRAPGISTASRQPSSSTPVARPPKKKKAAPLKVSALAFSHLPPNVARECAELTAKVWTEVEKAAARERIEGSNSARVRKAEQEKLDRAVQAEARLLRLMEERGDKPAGHRERQQRRAQQLKLLEGGIGGELQRRSSAAYRGHARGRVDNDGGDVHDKGAEGQERRTEEGDGEGRG